MHQIYIDPYKFYFQGSGMHLECMIMWDSATKMVMKCDFRKRVERKYDRWSLISLVYNIILKSGYDLTMTRDQFINMNIKRELFPGVEIKIEILSM